MRDNSFLGGNTTGTNLAIVGAVFVALVCINPVRARHQAGNQQREKKDDKQSRSVTVTEAGAVSSSPLALPFRVAWKYLAESAGSLPPSMDGHRVYIPQSDGRVACLDRQSGQLLWSSEPGGFITVPISIAQKAIYVATERVSEQGMSSGASIRRMDPETGLTRWAKDYPRSFESPIVLAEDRIYVGSSDGALYSLSAEDGKVIWKSQTKDVVRGKAEVIGQTVYFGGDDGALYGVASETGHEVWKYQAAGRIVGKPATDGKTIYFGSGDGFVYSVDLVSSKLKWKARVGAAVETSPIIVKDKILVGSFDNFLYALSRSTGDKVWKRRLDNRIAADPIVEGDAVLVAPLRSNYLLIFLNADGRRVSYYQLGREYEIVAAPAYFDGTLILPTEQGLIALRTQ